LVAAVALVTTFARRAGAHTVGLSQAEYRVDGASVHVTWVFAGVELAAALPGLGASGALTAAEVSAGRAELERAIVDATSVRGDGASCAPRFEGASSTSGDAVEIEATYVCPRAPAAVTVDCGFFDRLPAGHRHIASITGGRGEEELVLGASHRTFTVAGGPSRGSFAAMVWTGIQHIWTGYDHLAFLLGLVLAGGRPRALVGTITAFTVAHTLTLGLAVLHVVTPRASLVEPGIALSIVYVGLENLFVLARDRAGPLPVLWRGDEGVPARWRVAFVFGLLHGLGFASSLVELDLPRARVVPALLGFNCGVELGQLGVLAIVLPAILFARRDAFFRRSGTRALNVALVTAGAVWFVARVVG